MSELEQKKFTADETVDILADRSRIHPDAKAYFGNELVAELLDILENDEIFELDSMYLQGDLTVAEMEEYLMVLPSFHALNRRLTALGDKLVAHVTRRLEGTLSESVDKRGNFNNKRGLVRMQKSVFDIVESFSNIGYATKRNSLVHYLKNYLGQALMMDIWYRVVMDQRLYRYKEMLAAFIRSVDENFMRGQGHNYPGKIGLLFLSCFRSAYGKNHALFEKFLNDANADEKGAQSNTELAQEIDAEFSRIAALSHFRSIQSVSKKIGEVTVEIYADEDDTAMRSSDLACVKISFPGADPKINLKTATRMPDGSRVRVTNLEFDSFQFIINRHSGELILGGSMIALDKQKEARMGTPFISETEFLKMKAIIFRILREYLEGKPEDITKVFFTPTAAIAPVREETREQAGKQIEEEPASEAESREQAVKPTYEYKPFQREQLSAVPQEVQGEPEDREEAQTIEDIHLDGMYSEESVIAAVTRITGIPPLKSSRGKSRGKGSHVVVMGVNGARYPLPNHSGKDLSPAILKRCLQKLQIPYSVFKREY
jgi:hypothetical protein